MSDELTDLIGNAISDVWDDAPGPESLWAVKVVMVSDATEGEEETRTVYGPMLFPDREGASHLASFLVTPETAMPIMESWLALGWMSLPDERRWMPLGVKVVKVAPVPF